MTPRVAAQHKAGLANRRLQPLGHSSACGGAYTSCIFASNAGTESGESGESGESARITKVVTPHRSPYPLVLAARSARALSLDLATEPLPGAAKRRRRHARVVHKSGHSQNEGEAA